MMDFQLMILNPVQWLGQMMVELYFGSKKGLVAFYPHQLQTPSEPQNLKLVGLRIFNENVDVGGHIEDFIPLDSSIVYSKTLTATRFFWTISHLSLQYLAILHPHDIRLQPTDWMVWKISWINTSSERHFASYSNVPPGTYEFQATSFQRK